jgi:ATP-dependent DNA helicase RecQ
MLEGNGELTDASRQLLRDMERYATSVGCRHRRLVGYFGEAYARANCAACDYCLGELEPMPDAVVVARKILSCVARVGQRFGAAHVTNVLRGRAVEAVTARGHEALSTFGLLAEMPVTELRGSIEQLCAHGLLRQTDGEYPVLVLTPSGLALMKDERAHPDLVLVRQRRPARERPAPKSRAEAEGWEGVHRDLFERLRAVRLEIARERRVPPYVIFHDTTLRDMARRRPTTPAELLRVYGVGQRKAEDLGERFLAVIRAAGAS